MRSCFVALATTRTPKMLLQQGLHSATAAQVPRAVAWFQCHPNRRRHRHWAATREVVQPWRQAWRLLWLQQPGQAEAVVAALLWSLPRLTRHRESVLVDGTGVMR